MGQALTHQLCLDGAMSTQEATREGRDYNRYYSELHFTKGTVTQRAGVTAQGHAAGMQQMQCSWGSAFGPFLSHAYSVQVTEGPAQNQYLRTPVVVFTLCSKTNFLFSHAARENKCRTI